MIRYQKLSSGEAMSPGRKRLMSLSWTCRSTTASRPSRRKSGLKPISSSSPREIDRKRLRRLAHVLGLRRDRELALREPQPKRCVALSHHPRSAHHLEQRFPLKRDLRLERLWKQLLVVRELAVDAAAREPHVSGREDDVVLVHAELDVLPAAGETSELLQRAGGNDRVELRARLAECRLLHGEPVRVRRGHDQLIAFEANEDTREHRPRFVARRCAADLLDRLEKRRRLDLLQWDVEWRKSRKVLGAVDVQAGRVAPGRDRENAVSLLVRRRNRVVAGSRRTRSVRRRPGTTTAASPEISPEIEARIEISMSVAASVSRPSSALSRIPLKHLHRATTSTPLAQRRRVRTRARFVRRSTRERVPVG